MPTPDRVATVVTVAPDLPKSCEGCPLSTNDQCGRFTEVEGGGKRGVMIIAEASGVEEANEGLPLRPHAPSGMILEKVLNNLRMTRDDVWLTNIIRCHPPNNFLEGAPYERRAIDHCAPNLQEAIERLGPRAIVTLGATALRELTGNSLGKRSVTYLRGFGVHSRYDIPVVPTFHPAFLARGNTRFIGLMMSDVAKAVEFAAGRKRLISDPSTRVRVYVGLDELERLYAYALANPTLPFAYDIETRTSADNEESGIIEFERRATVFRDDDEPGKEVVGGVELGDPNDPEGDGYIDDLSPVADRESDITSIQFAMDEDEGVYVPWSKGAEELTRKFMALPNPRVAWNGWLFDDQKLLEEGIEITDSHDGMWEYKCIQPDLIAHLQAVAGAYGWEFPWKHYSGTNEELYGVCDVTSLIKIFRRLPNELQRMGIWDWYERLTRRYRQLVLLPTERRGIPMDAGRLDELRGYLANKVNDMRAELLSHVPDNLHQRDPIAGYTNVPEKIKPFVYAQHPTLFDPVPKLKKDGTQAIKDGAPWFIKSKMTVGQVYRDLCEGRLGNTLTDVLTRWPELRLDPETQRLYNHVPFNPGSSQQMINYIKTKGYKVPVRFKDGVPTTADKEMRRLEEETNDPVIRLSRLIRVHKKMMDSYTGKVGEDGVARGGWIPAPDGYLRTRYVFKSTGQLAALNPNVTTMPKRRGDLANMFRRCLVAKPGHKIVTFDYRAFHARTTGLEAEDGDYMRLSDLDIHSYVTSRLVIPMVTRLVKGDSRAWEEYYKSKDYWDGGYNGDPQELIGKIRELHSYFTGIDTWMLLDNKDLSHRLKLVKSLFKNIRDFKAKPSILGIGFGMSARRLYFENRETMSGEREARQLMAMLKRLFPKTFDWQERLLDSLRNRPYLQSRWGARRWFWSAWEWKRRDDGRWYEAKGRDAEKALAFLPANDAHGMLREKCLEMAEMGWLDKYKLANKIHDELLFHCPDEYVDECLVNVKGWMESPCPTLAHSILCPEGFTCAVEAAVGPDRLDMVEVK